MSRWKVHFKSLLISTGYSLKVILFSSEFQVEKYISNSSISTGYNLNVILFSSGKVYFKSWISTGRFCLNFKSKRIAQIPLNVYLLWSECNLIFIWIFKSKSRVQIHLNMYLFWSECTIKAHRNKFHVVWMLTVLNGWWLWSIHQ